MIHICNPRQKYPEYINTTSRSKTWSRGLSPFYLGPVNLYGSYTARNVENAWQFSKVYSEHAEHLRYPPNKFYFRWAQKGWDDSYAHRYPMGKGRKPVCSWWDGKRLDYVEARKKIYCPLYAQAVLVSKAYQHLEEEYKNKGELWLWDFDGYDHREKNMTYKDVVNHPDKKMGHAFVLAMLLEKDLAWEVA